MMNSANPTELGTLTFDQFRSIVEGTQPIPDDIDPEVLDLILDCIEVAGSCYRQPDTQSSQSARPLA
jgi:hypothetical protein